MTIDGRAAELLGLVRVGLSQSTVNQCTDFAIDANDEGRADLAILVLTPLADIVPNEPRVWQMLGLAHRAEQNSAQALAALARAAALNARDARIAAGHATVTMEAGLPSAVLFRTACDLAPNDAELLLSTIAALSADGHGDVAETLLSRSVAANPAWVRGHEALATLRWTMTGAPDFARGFAEGCAKSPTDLALRLAWQRALGQVGQWSAASAVIAQGRALFGSLAQFDAAEAHIATEAGDDGRAEHLFDRAVSVDDAGTRISHVRHCLRTGRIEQAGALAEALLAGPAAAMAWPYLSLIWRLSGDRRAAWLDGDPPMISTFDLPFEAGELTALADSLRALHLTRHHPAEQSLRGGTQTDGPLFARVDPAIQVVKARVLTAVRAYVDQLPAVDPAHPLLGTARNHLLFAGSWSVRLGAQGFHVCHTHPMGWISSALYIALPDAGDLGPAPSGWLQLGAPPPDLRIDLPAYALIEPKPGRLVLFPSTMWHGTMPFNDGERLTIAFDIAAPGR